MKKFLSYFLSSICFCSFIACTSCTDDSEIIARIADEVQDYVEETYDTKIELVSTTDDYDGVLYTFKDKSGFEFTAYLHCIHCEWWPETTYDDVYDNYISGYCKAHPEIFNIFKMGNHDFKMEGDGKYVLYYDSYDDIDEVAEFASKYIRKIELPSITRIPPSAYQSDIKINLEKLYFKPKGSDYKWNSYEYMSFPSQSYPTPEALSKIIKSWHIQQLQSNNDTEHLSQIPSEDIEKYGK